MSRTKLSGLIEALSLVDSALKEINLAVGAFRPIQYGIQFIVGDGEVIINCFTTGAVSVQGKDSPVKRAVQRALESNRLQRANDERKPVTCRGRQWKRKHRATMRAPRVFLAL